MLLAVRLLLGDALLFCLADLLLLSGLCVLDLDDLQLLISLRALSVPILIDLIQKPLQRHFARLQLTGQRAHPVTLEEQLRA